MPVKVCGGERVRNKDATSTFEHLSDGVLEQRVYYCQNFRGDVSALISSDGRMQEWVKYSAYGIPFGLPAGDADSDGDCDSADITQILTWKNSSQYDVRGDLDLDGDVDATDRAIAVGTLLLVNATLGKYAAAGGGRRATSGIRASPSRSRPVNGELKNSLELRTALIG